MNELIVNADDYGQSAAIDNGILALIEQGRVSAMSCLTNSGNWPNAAKLITDKIRTKAGVGLHLDFTEYSEPMRHSLPVLIAKSFARTLSATRIRETINNQLDAFEKALNTIPDHVDGHQHIHQLPQIREALIDVLLERYSNQRPWIRISLPPDTSGIKGIIIGNLGAKRMTQISAEAGFRYSGRLLGVYDFNAGLEQYYAYLDNWLESVHASQAQTPVLMCHPALDDDSFRPEINDPIHKSRQLEFKALSSPQFGAMLARHRIRIVRKSAIP